ncbi:aldo/keto reductase [Streptomyces sp. 150FB]|uniref:aldo/keto reductase n=1 Tax=Streptomyces sp. 150FB TaxID=1576605 RepID=UPI001F4861C0|nr:aldo/keto reductase [Streptomyces sp. 150FB]
MYRAVRMRPFPHRSRYCSQKDGVMENRALGSQGLVSSAEGLGCMGLSGSYGAADDLESVKTIQRAVELGVTMFDTADHYGAFSGEKILGRALAGRRDGVAIASKFGGAEMDDEGRTVGAANGRPEYVRASVERSLRHLDTDHIDLYYQHRVDPRVPVEETFGALGELVAAGKVRHLGLCEVRPETIRRAHATAPLTAVESEYSLFARDIESNGVLETVRELGIGFVSYAPLGRGFLTGTVRSTDALAEQDLRQIYPRFEKENFDANLTLLAQVEQIATGLGISSTQLALAWVIAQGKDVFAIPGTRTRRHLEENVAAAAVSLDTETLRTLSEVAADSEIQGARVSSMDVGIQL